jgi:cellobiose phosphorylase
LNTNGAYGYFRNQGREYVITTPRTPARWFNYLFNDTYYMEVSQTGQGDSISFHPHNRTISRGFRYFYLKDQETGEAWSPLYQPLKTEPEAYECIHSLGSTEIRSVSQEIASSIHVFVPRAGQQEIWTVTLTNTGVKPRSLSLFTAFSLENGGVMGSKCQFDQESQILSSYSFPYHVTYGQKAGCDDHTNVVYVYPDYPADSYDCSQRAFFGGDDIYELPAAVQKGHCSGRQAEAENPLGALQQIMTLQPGEQAVRHFVAGCASSLEEIRSSKAELAVKGYAVLLQEAEDYWEGITGMFRVETPDADVNAFMNIWLKKQIVMQTRTNRMSSYCPVRNQLQDALGYALVDPAGAAEYMISVLQGQERSGFIQQWIMTDGSPPKNLCLLKHTDGPVWLVICMTALLNQCGDPELLLRQVGFKGSSDSATIYQHLLLAVDYMAGETGAHGLCLMGDGDWNDPINGPGRLGRGESAWNTMALVYAIQALLPFCGQLGDKENAEHLNTLAGRLADTVNRTCWDGAWYVAGFDDDGTPFGTAQDEEGQLFLNTQTWAIMSGIAGGERLEQCLAAIESLDTPFGPRLLEPPFSGWNPKWGRISLKLAGTTENGSVYCHASMFKAFADCIAGRGSEAWQTISRTLPTNPDNPPEENGQVPIFVPNYYFGLADSPNYGKSSHHVSTGTVGWMLWTTLEYALGIRATAHGLVIDPCIPAEWPEYIVERKYRSASYRIHVLNPARISRGTVKVTVDGEAWADATLPYEAGREYRVTVRLEQ